MTPSADSAAFGRVNEHLGVSRTHPDEPLLVLDDLKTHFRTDRGLVRAVDGVSLSLRRGESLGVVGESGSGKTVLSRSIMGLLPSTAVTSGSVKFAGQEILGLPDKQMRHLWGAEMSMVFQNPLNSLNPLMKIGKQITEPLKLHLDMDRKNARATAAQLLRDVRIPEAERRLDQYPHELSGGMRQRVMIAMAIANNPEVLIADEPTTTLDVTVQAQIMELLRDLQHEHHLALVLITHDLGVVAGSTDRVAVMYAGRVVETGAVDPLFGHPGHPYTRGLLACLPRLDERHDIQSSIPGIPTSPLSLPPGCPFAPRCSYAEAACTDAEPALAPHHQTLAACFVTTRVAADQEVTAP